MPPHCRHHRSPALPLEAPAVPDQKLVEVHPAVLVEIDLAPIDLDLFLRHLREFHMHQVRQHDPELFLVKTAILFGVVLVEDPLDRIYVRHVETKRPGDLTDAPLPLVGYKYLFGLRSTDVPKHKGREVPFSITLHLAEALPVLIGQILRHRFICVHVVDMPNHVMKLFPRQHRIAICVELPEERQESFYLFFGLVVLPGQGGQHLGLRVLLLVPTGRVLRPVRHGWGRLPGRTERQCNLALTLPVLRLV
mmetsp:Transcript_71381/g.152532  ORF Transcript_71381/g.152532 Transcript_71381/m.152532 type:complete len:250 (+) Transcript_71381:77-826(+)